MNCLLLAEPTFVSHVNVSQSLERKFRKSWVAQSGSVRRMNLLPGKTIIREIEALMSHAGTTGAGPIVVSE